MKESCSRLEKSLEEGKMSSIQRLTELTKENAMFTKRLAEAEEIQKILLDQVYSQSFSLRPLEFYTLFTENAECIIWYTSTCKYFFKTLSKRILFSIFHFMIVFHGALSTEQFPELKKM